jgi:hypothetical protein
MYSLHDLYLIYAINVRVPALEVMSRQRSTDATLDRRLDRCSTQQSGNDETLSVSGQATACDRQGVYEMEIDKGN